MPGPIFWRPGTVAPGSSLDRQTGDDGEAEISLVGSALPKQDLSIQAARQRLPVYKHRSQFLAALEKYPVLIVQGAPGSGKTSQLPQYCHEAGWAEDGQIIACTQPRRIAATSVATRVAKEVGSVLGDEVGYAIRFEDLSSPTRTRIKYMTDGMLFREAMLDPLLSRYSVIMIDEAHERSLYTDLLLGLLKKIRQQRPELRLVISSATINAESFLKYFSRDLEEPRQVAAIMSVEGRMYPVEVAYLASPTPDYVSAAVQAICDIHIHQPIGDILLFLTGREEIDRCLDIMSEQILSLPRTAGTLALLPLHAGLTSEEQMAVFEPAAPRTRKVIIATNIAEASVTIEGIRYVIDSGHVKLRAFNPLTSMDILRTVAVSKASATQRAGRCGRTAAGKCFRLYTEEAAVQLVSATPPEICRSDAAQLVLQLKALGIDNIVRFDFMTPPPASMLERAVEYLYSLGALDDCGRLTEPLGLRLAELPVNPAMAKILISSAEHGCSDEILTIAAMTSIQSVFITSQGADGAVAEIEQRKFVAEEGDHLTLLNVYNAFVTRGRKSAKWCANHRLNFKALSRAVSIRLQLTKYLQRFRLPMKSCQGDDVAIRRCLVSGYFKNAAKFQPDGTYKLLTSDTTLHVHPSSIMFTRTPKTGYVIFHEVIETTKLFIRDLTVIDSDWLASLSNGYYRVS